MRIIAGTHRGRRLLPPDEYSPTRPIPDRVKQSLFDRLWSLGLLPTGTSEQTDSLPSETENSFNVPGGQEVLDLFSGTGSLGLETLSRGATFCTFVERDRSAIQNLRGNLEALKFSESARVVAGEALTLTWQSLLTPGRIGLIFVDPPYALLADPEGWNRVSRVLTALKTVVHCEATAMLRTPREKAPQAIQGWDGPDSRTYGSMSVHLYFNQR